MLRTHVLGEADLIVTLFAESSGRVRGVARGARKSRKRFGGALEPLTRVRATWAERPGRELHHLESLEPSRSYARMQADPTRQAACAVIAEIVDATVHEGQSEPRLFRLLGAVLDAIEEGLPPLAGVRYFELWTLRLHGLLSDLSRCATCATAFGPGRGRWASAAHGVLCARCRRSLREPTRRLNEDEGRFLDAALRLPPREMQRHGCGARRGGALDLMLRDALQSFVERGLRTYRHLETAVAEPPARER